MFVGLDGRQAPGSPTLAQAFAAAGADGARRCHGDRRGRLLRRGQCGADRAACLHSDHEAVSLMGLAVVRRREVHVGAGVRRGPGQTTGAAACHGDRGRLLAGGSAATWDHRSPPGIYRIWAEQVEWDWRAAAGRPRAAAIRGAEGRRQGCVLSGPGQRSGRSGRRGSPDGRRTGRRIAAAGARRPRGCSGHGDRWGRLLRRGSAATWDRLRSGPAGDRWRRQLAASSSYKEAGRPNGGRSTGRPGSGRRHCPAGRDADAGAADNRSVVS